MPKTEEIVINTSPLIAIMAAVGDLEILRTLYKNVFVPFEVCEEISAGGTEGFGIEPFEQAIWLKKWSHPLQINPLLSNSLDRGEASVIQLALDQNIDTVCIDETVGRRFARLSNLSVTGSMGILLRAKREGRPISIRAAIQKMKEQGIWISDRVVAFALREAGELTE
ncbi:DUF3368 domain-containing protein [candidate division KSB1 bacterium]|nr:DUF3368 domain-containing protein [candidate division KSB1 bacterium]